MDWSPAFINEVLEHSLPFDPETPAEPMRAVALDAHLGDALMQISAVVHANLPDRHCIDSAGDSLRANYRRLKNGKCLFAAGGNGYFRPLCYRINAAGWRPTGSFPAEAYLPSMDLSEEDCSMLFFYQTSMHNTYLENASFNRAVFAEADFRNAVLFRANMSSADFSGCNMTDAQLMVDSDARCNPVDSIGSSRESRVSHSEPSPSARFPRDKDGSARRNIEPLQ
jgi:hypothetical protein